jgi:glycosyltransferase involved in cell wall biosynthesis
MADPSLSIVIPTFNRAASVIVHDDHFMDEAARLGVRIFISDDSPDSDVRQAMERKSRTFANVIYRHNDPPLRHDGNVLSCLLWPDTDFVWVLGDVFRIQPGELALIKASLVDQDFQFVNWQSDDTRILPPVRGAAARDLIRDRLWHQTLTGATIFHRRVRSWAAERREQIRLATNFPLIAIIMGYATDADVSVSWWGRKSLRAMPKESSYWHHCAFDVFVDDWVRVIEMHPKLIPRSEQRAVLRSHSANSRLFNVEFLRRLKKNGHFDLRATRRHRFFDVMHLNRFMVLALLLPDSITVRAASAARRLRSAIAHR